VQPIVFLRSLTIRGFKSFADKVTLEFTPGVSVIVGPNGSGKSNIADAIAWVLGEQGPRALRGGHMADVIFAGSPTRQALGMAEVTMVIDNAAGLIPVPASEIEISRTIYRSGDSEYRLGGRPCRLMDIQELLSDTGVGRTLHTLIGQGSLDDVLQARPEERRLFIEEAAGIAKHRRRRERAERKLAGMEGDLFRLQDLVGELRRQLKPLKQQAELAERHESLAAEADELARKLAAARLVELRRERDRRRPAWEEAERHQAAARARMDALDAEISTLEEARRLAEEAMERAEAAHDRATTAKSDAEASLRAALREEARVRERLAQATNREGRLFALEEELDRMESALRDAAAGLAAAESELTGAEEGYRRAAEVRREAEEERRRAAEREAARRAEVEAVSEALERHRAEGARLGTSLTAVRAALAAAEARADELERRIEDLDAGAAPLGEELASLDRRRGELQERILALRTDEQGLQARERVVEARRQELSESPGRGFLRRRGDRPMGLLGDLIHAPADLETAVRAALGPFADAVVYADADAALADAGTAPGGLTLVVGGRTAATPDEEGVRIAGERALIDLVRPNAEVAPIVRRLLGSFHLAHNLAEAAAKHRVHPDAVFVTPEGTVVGQSYVRTAPGIDVRMEEVRREAAAIERELAAVRRGLREDGQALDQVSDRMASARAELESMDAAITAAAEDLSGAQSEVASARREAVVLSERAAAVNAAADAAASRLAAVPGAPGEPPPLPPIPEAPVHLRVEVEALRRERGRLETGVGRTRAEVEDLKREDPVALRSLLAEAEAERAASEEGLRSADQELDRRGEERREAGAAARQARARHTDANGAWRAAAADLDRIREEHEREDRIRAEVEGRLSDAERVLREGHGAEPDAAVALLGEGDTVEELQRRSDLVARRLGLLGRVNLLATGELEALKERHDFMVRELDDVKAARRDLEHLIEGIDRQMAELFDSAFRDVSREFSALFASLFPGGEGRLILTDPTDPLTTGIDVEARPGRKRVRRLSLLSGGERALSALAFLFAIFRARPSPFYLMDEVEAALDDVNLQRFLELVKDFATDSQILVVTHQKRTMEMADVLYGVSMGQGGASAVISQRLAEAAARTTA
jgi:chromosome segregation protein